MPEIGEAFLRIVPKATGIKGELEKEMGGAGESAGRSAGGKAGNSLLGALKGVVTVAAVTSALKATLDAGAELEQNLGGTEAVFGHFAETIQSKATEAYKNMGLGASDYMATANKMGALFQGSGLEQQRAMELTEQAMQRAADVASVMGIETSAAMESIAGAAKGNFTMMDNLGVAMNATTLEAYALEKGMEGFEWKSASSTEKAELAMQMFFDRTQQYAGNFARESEETFSGSLGAMRAAVQNVMAGIASGEDITPALSALGSTVSTFLSGNLIPTLTNIISALPSAMTQILTDLGPQLIPAGMGMITGLVSGLINSIPTLLETVAAMVPQMVQQLYENIPALIQGGVELLVGIARAVPVALPAIIEALPEIISAMVSTLIQAAPTILVGAVEMLWGIIIAIPKVLEAGKQAMDNMGAQLIKGLWNGILSVKDWLLERIRNFGQTVLSDIKGIFGIHSPSTEMAWMGQMLDEGLAQGIDRNRQGVAAAMERLGRDALGGIDVTAPGSRVANLGGVVINVTGAPGQDPNQIADAVLRRLRDLIGDEEAVFA